MELEKQRLLLSCLTSNRELYALCSGILKPSYFDPSLKKTVAFIQNYFKEYKDVPKFQTVRAETGMVLEDVGTIERADQAYVATEVEEFCRNRAVTEAILAGPGLLEKADFGKIMEVLKDAISVGLTKDLGLNYFDDPEERLRRTLESEARISTGWEDLDEALGGGISRQELIMFAANSGGGKSMTMLNLARNFLAQGLNGVYISLEMAEGVVSKRMDSMISKVSQQNLLRDMQKVANAITAAADNGMGKFYVKRMPEGRTNINHIRSYLLQLEQSAGFRPDFIVVDYIDIMGTTQSISLDNMFVKDKYVTEEIRSLGFDFDCIMISASQLGRGAIDAEKLTQAHIQGGISKINTSDYTVAIKQDDLMRAAGEIAFEILKSRNSGGVGKKLLLAWDAVSLIIKSLGHKQLKVVKRSGVVLDSSGTVFTKKTEGDDGVLSLMN